MNESGRMSAGDSSRESIVVISPSGVRMTMKPPPPMPHEYGSVTPRTAAAATAASTALPPLRSVSIAASVPSTSTVAAAPRVPVAVGLLPGSLRERDLRVEQDDGNEGQEQQAREDHAPRIPGAASLSP